MLPTEASIGDIVVLTHMMAISRHARLDVPCQVVNVRHYEAPNGAFKYTGIVCTTHELLEQTYMVMIRTSGNDKDYRLYRMDGMHAAKDVGEFILDDQKQNIKDEFMVFVEDPTTSEEIPVVWKSDSLGNIHGVKYKDSNVRSIVTLCELTTDSEIDTQYNLVHWFGTHVEGLIEMWYGTTMEQHEFTITKSAKPL